MATRKGIMGLLLLALAGSALACGDDSKDETPPDSGGFTRRDAGEEPDPGPDDEDAGSDASVEEDTLQASENEAKAKGWVEGCYKKPSTNEELLNSCAKGWREFDVSWYPNGYRPGDKLPTLP